MEEERTHQCRTVRNSIQHNVLVTENNRTEKKRTNRTEENRKE